MNKNIPIYEQGVLDFITVAVEFCALLEKPEKNNAKQFTDTMHKLLPLLYLKGALLPQLELLEDIDTLNESTYVKLEDYEYVRNKVASIMGEMDSYLDVFVDDMKYSDSPILSTISENIADIYQDIKNFIFTFRDGSEDVRLNAVIVCRINFQNCWGQKLTNVLRALHEINYREEDELYEEY